ncbi:GNAT family N-acetyltransferase [Streptomyces africanus]|uniref:GNAT family N-acetyltransferase n=1 Tax=Streptomyces africanus TaxID=231024 RepID=UPI001FC9FCC1|nr:GNAT family N-acetyltransferase [Streptomyces africanus]
MTGARHPDVDGPLLIDVTPGTPRMRNDVRPLVRILRPELTAEAFDCFAAEAHRQGLVFTAAYLEDGTCAGVATHRTLATSRGRILLVEDLVTDPGHRSTGIGARLLEEVVERARTAGCVAVELDSGVTNHTAHRFYHARQMRIAAFHFRLDGLR